MPESPHPASSWLLDVDRWKVGVPHQAFRELRLNNPVSWHEHPDDVLGFWSVNTWAGAYQVLHDPGTFSSRSGVVNLDDLEPAMLDNRRTFLEEDPPRHGQVRALLDADFSPRAVRRSEGLIAELSRHVVAAALPSGSEPSIIDAVSDLAEEVPIRVLARFLGVGEERLDDLVRWGNELLAAPPTDLDDAELAALPFGHPTALEVFAFADELAEQRADDDAGDITAKLLHGLVDGQNLSREEFRATWLMLVIAGNETTRHTITHGLLAFAEHPDAWQRFRTDASVEASAIEEIIRWATPINWHRRQVTTDVVLRGTQLRAGDKLIINFASANRDEERFEHPENFQIIRRPNHQMSFGRGGPHHCLGAHLTRLELRVFFRELAKRVDRIERAGEPRRLRSNHINGFVSAPILLRPAP